MSTTSLFIEIVIIGYMGCAWLAVIFGITFGLPNTRLLLDVMAKAQIPITVILTAFAYFFGILIDRLADSVLDGWDERIRKKIQSGNEPPVTTMQSILFVKSPESVQRFNYQQNRLRVVRAAILNLGILLLVSLIYVFIRVPSNQIGVSLLSLLIVIGGLWLASFFAYNRITWSYWGRTRREYLALGVRISHKNK